MDQQLAHGTPVPEQFRGFAAPLKRPTPNIKKFMGIVSGAPNAGKTSLFLSCPDALLLNVDGTTLPSKGEGRAFVWPLVEEDGTLTDENGRPMLLTFEKVRELVLRICTAAAEGKPHPEMVVFDTLPALSRLAMNFVVKQERKKDGKQNVTWEELDGRWTYPRINSYMGDLFYALHDHGIGCWLTCHYVKKLIDLPTDDEDRRASQEYVKLLIHDSFWSSFYGSLDTSLLVVEEQQVETQVIGRRPTQITRDVRILTGTRSKFIGIQKCRVPLEDVVLPVQGAWDAFEKAYKEAHEKSKRSNAE